MSRASKTGVRGLYRGADGAFRLDFRWVDLATGERKRFREKLATGTKAAAAKLRATSINNQITAGTFDPDREAPITLRAAFDRYLAHCEAHAIRSVRSRRTHAAAWCAFLGEKASLASVAAFDLERAKVAFHKPRQVEVERGDEKVKRTLPGRSPATINRHLATFKQLARWAVRAGVLDAGRAAELRDVKLLREPEGRVRWLSEDESKAINEKLVGWLRPIVLVAIGTGARRTEIAGLRWGQVDFEHGQLVLTRTKSGRTRHVPIAPSVRAILEAQPKGPSSGFVFHVPSRAQRAPEGKRRRSEEERRGDVTTKAWRAFCADHGLEDLRVHDLRHHAATAMRRAGHGLDVVAGVLGHADIRTAARYAHVGRADLAAAVAAAAASIPDAQPLPTSKKRKARKGA